MSGSLATRFHLAPRSQRDDGAGGLVAAALGDDALSFAETHAVCGRLLEAAAMGHP